LSAGMGWSAQASWCLLITPFRCSRTSGRAVRASCFGSRGKNCRLLALIPPSGSGGTMSSIARSVLDRYRACRPSACYPGKSTQHTDARREFSWITTAVGGHQWTFREGIEPPTRGFSGVSRGFQGFINQPLAASCRPLPRHTKAQLRHTQSELVTPPSQPALVDRGAPRSIAHVNHLWLLGHDLAVFPNVNRCSVHTRHFSGSTCGTPHPAADTGGKALRLLWRFSSSGHGPRSSNLGLDSEFSYIAQ